MAGPRYDRSLSPRPGARPSIDTGRLWGGGAAAGAVAALVAVIGLLIARGILDIPLTGPMSEGAFGDSTTVGYIVLAGVGGLLATFLLQTLVQLTPTPIRFYSWISGLVTALITIAPLATDEDAAVRVATALINLCVGMVYVVVLPQVAASSITRSVRGVPGGPRS